MDIFLIIVNYQRKFSVQTRLAKLILGICCAAFSQNSNQFYRYGYIPKLNFKFTTIF